MPLSSCKHLISSVSCCSRSFSFIWVCAADMLWQRMGSGYYYACLNTPPFNLICIKPLKRGLHSYLICSFVQRKAVLILSENQPQGERKNRWKMSLLFNVNIKHGNRTYLALCFDHENINICISTYDSCCTSFPVSLYLSRAFFLFLSMKQWIWSWNSWPSGNSSSPPMSVYSKQKWKHYFWNWNTENFITILAFANTWIQTIFTGKSELRLYVIEASVHNWVVDSKYIQLIVQLFFSTVVFFIFLEWNLFYNATNSF